MENSCELNLLRLRYSICASTKQAVVKFEPGISEERLDKRHHGNTNISAKLQFLSDPGKLASRVCFYLMSTKI